MIGYITLGTNDLERACGFYDALFADIGAKRLWSVDRGVAWGKEKGPSLGVMKPFDGNAATPGNGNMAALAFRTTDEVDVVYAKAIALGASSEGAPGLRGGKFYGAYFRDLDGNKLCAFCMT
jgi:catechol 2,3-dioxygenase-like lactoylglutathione lyase family enzyme